MECFVPFLKVMFNRKITALFVEYQTTDIIFILFVGLILEYYTGWKCPIFLLYNIYMDLFYVAKKI